MIRMKNNAQGHRRNKKENNSETTEVSIKSAPS